LLFSISILFSLYKLSQPKPPPLWFGDFQAFYATAQIALTKGFSQIYNLQLQSQFQQALYHQSLLGLEKSAYVTAPMPYLPAFVLLFIPLLIFKYLTAYEVWILVNILLFLLYLVRFTRVFGKENGRDLLFQLFFCIPVISNFIIGQVNVFLLVFLGEFFLASLSGKNRLSGLWLSGLLLKPQILILILPGLLIKKQYKTLSGFIIGSTGLMILSLILAGPYGLTQLSRLILSYLHELPSNSPEVMVNWRALGTNLSASMPGLTPWIITFAGMIVTVLIVLSLWRLPVESNSPRYGVLLLGTFAGTFAVTWHAHDPMLIAVLPLILFLYARKLLPLNVLAIWLLAPPIYFAITYLIAPENTRSLFGLSYLAVNLVLLGWATMYFRLFIKTARQGSS
jgi:hypothetical protein